MSKHSELHAALEEVSELEMIGVSRKHAVIQAADEWGFTVDAVETALSAQERREGSMTRYDLDIETKLSDGRLVQIIGTVRVLHQCDCMGASDLHTHIDDVQVESVVQLFDAGTAYGGVIDYTSKELVEIEQILENEAYALDKAS
jgi:hypothetical protein